VNTPEPIANGPKGKPSSAPARLSPSQWSWVLLVAGGTLLVVSNLDWIVVFLPLPRANLSKEAEVLVAIALIALGVFGVLKAKASKVLQRWSNNCRPIYWDLILFGMAAGVVIGSVWRLAVAPRSWWPYSPVAGVLPVASYIRWSRLKANSAALANNDSARAFPVDEPLQDLTAATDAFGRLNFVSAFADSVKSSDPQSCHVFGLVGPWGSGKTTVLHALTHQCDQSFYIVNIDSWALRDTGRLTEAILNSIVQEIEHHYLVPDLKRNLVRYLSLISPTVKNVPSLEAMAKVFVSSEELQSLKRRIESATLSISRRILVIIDDVDRLDSAEFHSLLKTVRLCASFPRVVYVLSYDRDSIYQLIAGSETARAAAFMDKVVEDEWVLPLIPHDKLVKYLRIQVPGPATGRPPRFIDDFNERLEEALPPLRELLKTPRQIKRAGIALSRRSSLCLRLNPFDAFLWEALRQREPLLYDFIRQKPWIFRADAGLEVDYAVKLLSDAEERKKLIAEIDSVITKSSETAESTRQLFWTLFAKETHSSEEREANEIRLRRICNSRFFDAYFLLDTGEGLSRPEQLDTLVMELNNATEDGAVRRTTTGALKSAIEGDWLDTWTTLMSIYGEDLKAERVRPVIDAIHEFHDKNLDPKSSRSGQLMRGLAELNIALLLRLPSHTDVLGAMSDLLTKTAALPLASVYAHVVQHGQHHGNLVIQRIPDPKELCVEFDKRLENEVMTLGSEVFKQPAHLRTLLTYYTDKSKLWAFIQKATGSDASNWARVLMFYVRFWDNGFTDVDSDEIRAVPRDVVNQAYRSLKDEKAWGTLSDYEKRAVRTFVNWFAETQGPGDKNDSKESPT